MEPLLRIKSLCLAPASGCRCLRVVSAANGPRSEPVARNRTASQIALIIDGAFVTGLTAEPADLRGDLVDAAMKLLA
jgi:hypothetical protein